MIRRLTIAWIFALLGTTGTAQLLNFEHYGLERGLPATGVYDFAMGPDGKLWMATDGGGLAAFDGERFGVFERYRNQRVAIRALETGPDGSLWAGAVAGGVCRIDTEVQCWGKEDGLTGEQVLALAALDTNRVAVATTQHLHLITPDGVEAPNWKLPDPRIRDLLATGDTLWVATRGGLAMVVDHVVSVYTETEGLLSNSLVTLEKARGGGIWIGTADGVQRLHNGVFYDLPANPDLPIDRVRAICETADGTLWLGTYNGAIRVRNGQKPEMITTANGLSDNRIRSIFQDTFGNVWFATYMGGACELRNTAFEHYTAPGQRAFAFTAIAENDSGMVVGIFENGVGAIVGNSFVWRDREDYTVRCITAPYRGVHWFTTDRGLFWLDADGAHRPPVSDTLGLSLFYTAALVDDQVWASNQNRILARDADPMKDDGFKVITAFSEPDVILDFVLTPDSTVWAITDRHIGYARLGEDSVFRVIEAPELEGQRFSDIACDAFGHLWAGTLEGGVFRLSNGRIKQLNTEKGLAHNRVHQLVFDDMENLWIGGLRGIHQVVLTAGNELIEDIRVFTYREGLRSMHTSLRAGFRDSQNRLWFGTVDGLTHYDPGRKETVRSAPVTEISAIDLFFDRNTDWKSRADSVNASGLPIGLSLPYDQNHLTFHFHGIDLTNPEGVRYQYKLEGLEEWSPITSNREVTYANIPPGEYTFLVTARSADGVWNAEPVAYSFAVRSPFYTSGWFVFIVALLLGALVRIGLRLRDRQFRRERERLEQEVEARTADLRKEMQKSDELLLNILPESAARELKEKGFADARQFREVSVLFTDFEGFTTLAEKLSTSELVSTLDACFKAFDEIIERYGMEKIKTIGDAYMCAAGLPNRDDDHAVHAVQAALDMHRFMAAFNAERAEQGKPQWKLRVGIHSGPVIAGIVGRKKFAYDIWGDTVNLAARIESAGEAGRVNISAATRERLAGKVATQHRGKIAVKNKGEVEMYFVEDDQEA